MHSLSEGRSVLDGHWPALQVFDPVLAWARERFGADFAVDDSIFGAHQSEETVAALRRYLESAARGPLLGRLCCHALPCLAQGRLPVTCLCGRAGYLNLPEGDEHAVWMHQAGCSKSRLVLPGYALNVGLSRRA